MIEKMFPGELEGDINPEDYGFGVIREEPLTPGQAAELVNALYSQVKERTGLSMPKVEDYIDTLESEEAASAGLK
jgi:hypothetical protein